MHIFQKSLNFCFCKYNFAKFSEIAFTKMLARRWSSCRFWKNAANAYLDAKVGLALQHLHKFLHPTEHPIEQVAVRDEPMVLVETPDGRAKTLTGETKVEGGKATRLSSGIPLHSSFSPLCEKCPCISLSKISTLNANFWSDFFKIQVRLPRGRAGNAGEREGEEQSRGEGRGAGSPAAHRWLMEQLCRAGSLLSQSPDPHPCRDWKWIWTWKWTLDEEKFRNCDCEHCCIEQSYINNQSPCQFK